MSAGEVRSGALCVLFALMVACGPAPQTSSTTPTPPPQHAGEGGTARRLDPDTELARTPELMRYRPQGAEPFLVALDESPADPNALFDAAEFYATGDVAGMSLLWLMMRASMSSSLPMEETSRMVADILQRRVERIVEGGSRTLSVRLAPGAALILPTDHGRYGALAHMLEIELAVGLGRHALRDNDQWTQVDVVDSLRFVVQAYRERESIVHPHVEWIAWADGLERAGHLEAFVARLMGTSMPAGSVVVSEAARAAEAAYVARHPFRPNRSILPDDFIPLPQR